MKVLLKKDIRGVGRKDEIKNVSDGYFRNFLMPQGLAVPVTESVLHTIEVEKKLKEAAKERNKSTAELLGDDIRAQPLIIKGKMDEKGHLFGSVNAAAIEQELKQKGFDLSKLHGKILLAEPLKEGGTHMVAIQFPEGVKVECAIIIEKQ